MGDERRVAKVVLLSPEQLHRLTRTAGESCRYFAREAFLFLSCNHVGLEQMRAVDILDRRDQTHPLIKFRPLDLIGTHNLKSFEL